MTQHFKFFFLILFLWLTSALISCSTNEEKVILSLLESLKKKSEINKKLNKLELLAEAKKVEKYFCSSLEIVLLEGAEYSKSYNLNEIRNSFIKYKSFFSSLELSIQNPKVSINGNTATVSIKASALGEMPKGEGKFFELHEVLIELEKIDGEWRICKASQARNLRE